MENLLCDEVWLSSPTTPDEQYYCFNNETEEFIIKEEILEAFMTSLGKEKIYMPELGYVQRLRSSDLISTRFKAIQWLIKSRRRLNLSYEIIFSAANYLDRFISMNPSHGWEDWMFELLSVASLSIAAKFNEISAPLLHDIQMKDLKHSFLSSTIQQMELILLSGIGWRLSATTSYSFMEILLSNIDVSSKSYLHNELTTQVTQLLLEALLDYKLVEYTPSVVAVSALWCCLKELYPAAIDPYLDSITRLFDGDQQDNIVKCHMIMEAQPSSCHDLMQSCYSSPVTVLLNESMEDKIVNYRFVDFSAFEKNANPLEKSEKKRKRED